MKVIDLLESKNIPELKIIDINPYVTTDDDDGLDGMRYFRDRLKKYSLNQYDAVIVNYHEDLDQSKDILKFLQDKHDGLTNLKLDKYPDKETEDEVIANNSPKLKSRITGDGNNCLYFFSKTHPEQWKKVALIDIYHMSPNS